MKRLNYFITSLISSLENINVAKPGPNIFLWVAASVADVATINPNVVKTFLADSLNTFPIKGNPFFNNGPKSFP